MKNVKKIVSLTMALGFVSSTIAFAEIPKSSVVIGGRSYELSYADDKKNLKELLNAIKQNKDEIVLIKLEDGNWYDNETKKKVDPKILPMSLYKDSEGNLKAYDIQDGQELSKEELEFKVNNIIINPKGELVLGFSYTIATQSLKVKIDGEDIPEKSLKLSDDGYSIIAKLNKTLPKEDAIKTIILEGEVESVFGEKVDAQISTKVLVLNGATNSSNIKEFKGNISVTASNRKVTGLNVDGNIDIMGNKCTIENSTIKGTLNINPGTSGDAIIKKVNADKINIKSGSNNSIRLNEVISKRLFINSDTKANVILEGKSKMNRTVIESEAILNNKNGDFGNVIIENLQNSKKIIELIGKFEDVLLKGSCAIKTGDNTQINKVSIYTMNNGDNITLDGIFKNVFVESGLNALELAKNSYIYVLNINKDTAIVGDKSVGIGKVESNSQNKPNVDSNINVGKQPPTTGGGGGIGGGGISVNKPKPNQTFQSKEFILKVACGKEYVDGETTVELELKLKDNIEANNYATVTIFDNNKNIVYIGQAKFVDGGLKLNTILKGGKYQIKINPSINLETVVLECEI